MSELLSEQHQVIYYICEHLYLYGIESNITTTNTNLEHLISTGAEFACFKNGTFIYRFAENVCVCVCWHRQTVRQMYVTGAARR